MRKQPMPVCVFALNLRILPFLTLMLFCFYAFGAVTLLIYHHLFHLKVEDLLSAETWR